MLKRKLLLGEVGGEGGKGSHAHIFMIHHPFPNESQKCHMRPHNSLLKEHLVPTITPNPVTKRELKEQPFLGHPLKPKLQAPLPSLPISYAQESDCSPSALKRFHWCLLPLSYLSFQLFRRTNCLTQATQHRAAFLPLPMGFSPQVLKPFTLWFQRPLWPLDCLF